MENHGLSELQQLSSLTAQKLAEDDLKVSGVASMMNRVPRRPISVPWLRELAQSKIRGRMKCHPELECNVYLESLDEGTAVVGCGEKWIVWQIAF